ncbi:hypothetical protein BKA57DRAFT_517324 [Linnemannia elongata]|nr:hypothetical protein BKA57DRAFT_517324 [Linnemannia elongata]
MSTQRSPKTVLISGAGMGGLTLGALLEKSGTPYLILEQAATIKPLGATLCIGGPIMPLLIQLGIYDEFVAIAIPSTHLAVNNENQETLFVNDFSLWREYTGYSDYVVSRSKLYDLLADQIPPEKLLFGKRVQTVKQTSEKVLVQTEDGLSYEGDILVGADGAYSAVRRRLYETLSNEGRLPKGDKEDLPFSCTCLFGQTKVLDPEKVSILKKPLCQFLTTLGDNKPYTWATLTTRQNTISWLVVHHLQGVETKSIHNHNHSSNDNAEWGPYAAKAMCDQTRGFPISIGDGLTTLGDIIDLTPPDLISKVALEEKVFETWYSGRVVLMGDACHKISPAGAQGAMNAMHDAAALANALYALPSVYSVLNLSTAFQEYKTERLPPIMESFKNSQLMGKTIERGLGGTVTRFLMQHKPDWLWRLILKGMVKSRPLAGWLEEVPVQGSVVPNVSASEVKARAIFKQRAAEAAPVSL